MLHMEAHSANSYPMNQTEGEPDRLDQILKILIITLIFNTLHVTFLFKEFLSLLI